MTEKTSGIIPAESGQQLFTQKPSGEIQGRRVEILEAFTALNAIEDRLKTILSPTEVAMTELHEHEHTVTLLKTNVSFR